MPLTKGKVLIVHAAEVTRLGLCELVNRSERWQVCGHTSHVPTARELFVRHRPKLAVLGLTLRGGSGIQLIKDFRKLDGVVGTLVLSARDDALSIQRALRAGARGYLMINDSGVEILKALDEISAGHLHIGVNVLPRLIEPLVTGKIDRMTSELSSLSDRELEIFSLMGRGLARSELAMELHTSPKTIETHQMRIKDKLGLAGAAQLKEKASRWVAECTQTSLQRRSPNWRTNGSSMLKSAGTKRKNNAGANEPLMQGNAFPSRLPCAALPIPAGEVPRNAPGCGWRRPHPRDCQNADSLSGATTGGDRLPAATAPETIPPPALSRAGSDHRIRNQKNVKTSHGKSRN